MDPAPLPAFEPFRLRLSAWLTRAAPWIIAIDGLVVVLVGLYSVYNSFIAFQGESFILLMAGLGLLLFGVMMMLRWNLPLVRIGLVGLVAGYFGEALQEFQVATDPCDIGATMERCASHVPGGIPWEVYQGPFFLALLLFVMIAFQPALTREADR